MASAISPALARSGRFVELGAGTGPVTEALLRHGVPPSQLYAVEKSEALAKDLSERFPDVNVLCCSADDIGGRIGDGPPVKAVVSSLPFRSIPKDICFSIMSELDRVLAPGGLYIQFTYALIGEMPYVPSGFRKLRSRIVLLNMPPAKVEVFRKPKRRAAEPESRRARP
jgi:phospholipid N-methyltransferase